MAVNAAPRVLGILAAGWMAVSPVAAIADDSTSPGGILDTVLETLDFKAKPAEPPPEFVRKTRPDVSGLDYMQGPLAHRVSPIPTKTPAEVEAAKAALDAARNRQLAPAPPPIQIVKPQDAKPKTAKGKTVSSAKPPN